MKSSDEKRSGWLLILGLSAAVLALTAGPALAALTFSGTKISGDSAVVIDSSGTISIGTSTATGVTIGSGSSTVMFGSETGLPPSLLGYEGFVTLAIPNPYQSTGFGLEVAGSSVTALYSVVADTGGGNSDAVTAQPNLSSAGASGAGLYVDPQVDAGIAGDTVWGIESVTPNLASGASLINNFAFYSYAQGGVATNNYDFWADEQGVFRIKADKTFNNVYQAIPALYNPQFTKYTPGAANYERLTLGEWNSNIAEIGTENSGSGSARALAFITASTTRMTIGSTGNVGIGTPTPSTTFQVVSASSTIRIGTAALPGCLEMGNSDGSAGITYITTLNGVMSATTTKPNACQ